MVELAAELRCDGAEVEHCRCDIDSAADSVALVDNTPARYGRLDGAFNNAGISGGIGRLADLSEERFDERSRVNFKSIWLAMRAEIAALLRNPHAGANVNTSRVDGLRGGPNLSAYPATKRAVIGHTTTAAHDYGRDGLRVNAIAPRTTDIDMIAAWKRHDPGIAERLNAISPLGRGGQPSEVAEAAACMVAERPCLVCFRRSARRRRRDDRLTANPAPPSTS